jgi:hypothetical protein
LKYLLLLLSNSKPSHSNFIYFASIRAADERYSLVFVTMSMSRAIYMRLLSQSYHIIIFTGLYLDYLFHYICYNIRRSSLGTRSIHSKELPSED